MLKTLKDDRLICITQPDHAAVSGYLASHWGNSAFVRPGYYADAPDPERLRDEVVFAISQHDNGWWEWEASPRLDDDDGLPVHLTSVLGDPAEAMGRWRTGTRRFAEHHPYASLLIAFHAYYLYAPRANALDDPAFAHPLFAKAAKQKPAEAVSDEVEQFLTEIRTRQAELIEQLESVPDCRVWTEDAHYLPHGRLLQLADALSLALCSTIIPAKDGQARGFGEDHIVFFNVPRTSWDDRITMSLSPVGAGEIAVDPYPFDKPGLEVIVPHKAFKIPPEEVPLTRLDWHAAPTQQLTFHLIPA